MIKNGNRLPGFTKVIAPVDGEGFLRTDFKTSSVSFGRVILSKSRLKSSKAVNAGLTGAELTLGIFIWGLGIGCSL